MRKAFLEFVGILVILFRQRQMFRECDIPRSDLKHSAPSKKCVSNSPIRFLDSRAIPS
jgi:hypothetical protein